MSKSILQADGTRCYSGPTCQRHGAYNKKVLTGNFSHENLDPNTIFTSKHSTPSSQRTVLEKAKELIHKLPLKEMEASLLTHAILDDIMKLKHIDYEKVAASIEFAAYLHRKQTRANRGDLPRTPYIEHPLRNTLRVLRLDCEEEDVIIACVLHDTVEDCPETIAREFVGREPKDAHEAREIALEYISEAYGKQVAYLVEQVSNPIYPEGLTKAEKRVLYTAHVKEIIKNPKVCIIKYADLADNAFGLHHNSTDTNKDMIKHLAVKYEEPLNLMEERFEQEKSERLFPVSDEGFLHMQKSLASGKISLARLRNL